MAYTFTTSSGANYLVSDGRVTRTASHGIVGIDELPEVLTVTRMTVAPEVGRRAHITTREVGPFTTSPVVAVTPLADRRLVAGWAHREFDASDVVAWYTTSNFARTAFVQLPVVTRTCWFCGTLVDVDRQDTYTVSRISGDSKYGYEPCHHHCGD